jgi:hypothetical protein
LRRYEFIGDLPHLVRRRKKAGNMSKKTNKTTKAPSPKLAAKQVGSPYPVEQEDLDAQRERVRKAAAAGAGALKTPLSLASSEQSVETAAVANKPLAPLGASWPGTVSPQTVVAPPATAATTRTDVAVAAIAQTPLAAQAALPQAQKTTTPKPSMVRFFFSKAEARQVSVCGQFNDWSPTATPMNRQSDGHWETTVALRPGRYEYKFLVDGDWLLDPAAQGNVPNDCGSLNSVLEVGAYAGQ